MNTTHNDHLTTTRKTAGLSLRMKTALLMVAIVGAFHLLREHWNHVAGNWVYLLLLACPLMHVFHGHGGHGSHGGQGGHGDPAAPSDTSKV